MLISKRHLRQKLYFIQVFVFPNRWSKTFVQQLFFLELCKLSAGKK